MILSPDQYRLRYRVELQNRVAAPDLEELNFCDFTIDWEELYSCGGLDFDDYEDETAHKIQKYIHLDSELKEVKFKAKARILQTKEELEESSNHSILQRLRLLSDNQLD